MHIATELMTQRGYAATTIADVATAAEVSVPFIYAAFGNKAALLKQIFDIAIAGDDEPVPIRDRRKVAEVKAAATARSKCELNAELIGSIHARTAKLHEVMRDAAGTDHDVAALIARHDQGRRFGMAEFIEVLASAGQLRADQNPEQATDIVWAIADPCIYHRLVTQRQWSPRQYQTWLADTIYNSIANPKTTTSARKQPQTPDPKQGRAPISTTSAAPLASPPTR